MLYFVLDYLKWRAERPLLAPHDSWSLRKAVWKQRRPRYRRTSAPQPASPAYYRPCEPKHPLPRRGSAIMLDHWLR